MTKQTSELTAQVIKFQLDKELLNKNVLNITKQYDEISIKANEKDKEIEKVVKS